MKNLAVLGLMALSSFGPAEVGASDSILSKISETKSFTLIESSDEHNTCSQVLDFENITINEREYLKVISTNPNDFLRKLVSSRDSDLYGPWEARLDDHTFIDLNYSVREYRRDNAFQAQNLGSGFYVETLKLDIKTDELELKMDNYTKAYFFDFLLAGEIFKGNRTLSKNKFKTKISFDEENLVIEHEINDSQDWGGRLELEDVNIRCVYN